MKNLDLKKILKYLTIFTILCIILFYANSLNVKAASLPSSCQFYDNLGSSATQLLTIAGDGYWTTENSFTLTANSYGGIAVCSLDTPIVNNNVYSLSAHFDLINASSRTSSKPNLGLGNSVSEALTSYLNNTNLTENSISYSSSVLSYVFTANSNGSFIAIPFGSTSTISITPYLRNFTITYQGNSNQLTSEEMQTIINNSNSSITNSLDDNLSNCHSNIIPSSLLNSNGEYIVNGEISSTQWIKLGNITLQPGKYTNLLNYSSNSIYLVINDLRQYDTYSSLTFELSSTVNSSVYLRIGPGTYNNVAVKPAILTGHSTSYVLPGQKKCTSKLDDTNDKLDDLNSNLTNSSDPNLALDDVAGWLPAGPVDSVLNLPLTILNSLISNLSNRTCTSVDLPLPYIDKTIQLPCLSTIFNQTGFTDVLNTISVPFAIFIYINTLIKLYGWVDETLQFREEHWNDVDQWGGI